MDRYHFTAWREVPERAYLAAVQHPTQSSWEVQDLLEELAQLADSAGAQVVGSRVLRLREIHPAYYVGSGQASELGEQAKAAGAEIIVFDEDLSPVQGRNLEKLIGLRVVDRTQLILHIFARRAQTSEGRLQVELAQLEYLRPRLRGLWTAFEQQRGGIGLKGPGEKQLELDRRRLDRRIHHIRRELEAVRARREELRRGRTRHGWALVALVGYTNAGKSTLLNRLTDANVYADDRLFATLDPTTRRIDLPHGEPALLTDTVGFIRKLPHHLVDAFRATLEEVTEADLLVHVIDASHARVEAQIDAVRSVLRDLGAEAKPVVHALNKIDRPNAGAVARRLQSALPRAVAISALTGVGLEELREHIADALQIPQTRVSLRLPLTEGRIVAQLREAGRVEELRYEADGIYVRARVPAAMRGRWSPYESPDGSG